MVEEGSTYQDFDDIVLVPRGRFLFTTSVGDIGSNVYVKLWDLGQPESEKYSHIILLARLVGKFRLRILATAPTPDGLGIPIVVNEKIRYVFW